MIGRHRQPSDPADTSRRRFLGALAALFGIGTGATVLRRRTSTSETTATTASSSTTTSTSDPTTSAPSTGAADSSTAATGAPAASTDGTTTTTEATTTTSTEGTTTTTQPATTVTTQPPDAGGGITLLERAAWGAQPAEGGFEAHTPVRITVHHTAQVLGANSNAPKHIRGHQTYHQSLGWPDLAYHVMVDRAGNLYEGRPMDYRGDTATSYDPSGHFLPCLEGDHRTEVPTDIQMEALARVCAWAVDRWSLDSAEIFGHRDWASTTCPGDILYAPIDDGSLSARVAEIVAVGAPSLSYLRGEEAASVVAAIEAGG